MYIPISIDITQFKGDAILNSLGQDYMIPGALYFALQDACNDRKALRHAVNARCEKNHSIGHVFMTESFGLPCKYIIHCITPYRREEKSKSLPALRKTYESVIDFAHEKKIKKLCLPFIGTGANGYSIEEVFGLASTVIRKKAKQYPDMMLYFDVYQAEHPDKFREEAINRERSTLGLLRLSLSYDRFEERFAEKYGFKLRQVSETFDLEEFYFILCRGVPEGSRLPYSDPRYQDAMRRLYRYLQHQFEKRSFDVECSIRINKYESIKDGDLIQGAIEESNSDIYIEYENPIFVQIDSQIKPGTSFSELLTQYFKCRCRLGYSNPKNDAEQERYAKKQWAFLSGALNVLGDYHPGMEDIIDSKKVASHTYGSSFKKRFSPTRKDRWYLYWVSPSKTELLMIAYILKMNVKDIYYMYKYCGYWLSEKSKLDEVIKSCITQVNYEKEGQDGLLELLRVFSAQANVSIIDCRDVNIDQSESLTAMAAK